ncbi:uncharacterized protein LOC142612259 [Castanea sativa]|uniref:uncharacterized protein LOC142612259 n=1 Tax=Castanea sativa TaxID=21020 RepID=UPI003F64FABA
MQSIAAAVVELTHQSQKLTQEINQRRQRPERCVEGQAQSQEGREEENVEYENQSRGTASRRVPHLEKEMDQMRKIMDEMRENMRRTNPIDDLVHRTDYPFIASINNHPLPSKLKMPSLDSYNGTCNLCDHIATFKTTMHLQGVPDEIMCRAFPTTLKGPARVWFSKIPLNTVGSFEELSKLFVNNFIRGQRHNGSSSSLLTIEQGENESLQSFITHFNREALTIDKMDDKLLLVAFHNGVSFDLFIHKIYDQEPQTMAKLVHSAQSFMNVEDAIIAKKRKRAKRVEADLPCHPELGPRPKKARMGEKKDRENRKSSSSSGRIQHYTPLNIPFDQVLMQIKNDPSLKWPKKMKGYPNKRNKNNYYHFHRDHEHDTNE